jgi:hypothetical protein
MIMIGLLPAFLPRPVGAGKRKHACAAWRQAIPIFPCRIHAILAQRDAIRLTLALSLCNATSLLVETRQITDGSWTHDRSGGASPGFVDGEGITTGGVTIGSKNSEAGTYAV